MIEWKILGRWQSGQLHQTVNLTPSGYGGSNPSLPTSTLRPAELRSAGTPSIMQRPAELAESAELPTKCRSSSVVERFLGKKEVESPILSFGSIVN